MLHRLFQVLADVPNTDGIDAVMQSASGWVQVIVNILVIGGAVACIIFLIMNIVKYMTTSEPDRKAQIKKNMIALGIGAIALIVIAISWKPLTNWIITSAGGTFQF